MMILFKAHNSGYTRRDGTVVKPFDDKRPAARKKPKRSVVSHRHDDTLTGDLYDRLPDRQRGKGTEAGREAAKRPGPCRGRRAACRRRPCRGDRPVHHLPRARQDQLRLRHGRPVRGHL